VVQIAPRLSPRLVAEIGKLDCESVPIAETWRRTRAVARRLGLPEPSYERVRTIVHMHRRFRRHRPSTASVVADVVLYTRPPTDLLERAAGIR
jgi:hypothetical protein